MAAALALAAVGVVQWRMSGTACHEVTLYEPRTGRVVTTSNLQGDTAADCPDRFLLFEGEPPGPWDSNISGAQWTETLDRFVDP